MSKKNSKKKNNTMNRNNTQIDKKAVVLRTGKREKSYFPLIIITICIVLSIVIAIYLFNRPLGKSAKTAALGKEIVYPISLFDDSKARYYQIEIENGLTIKYFILKSSDGVIRAAFDACDVCWPEGKGYAQSGDYMICRNCGKRFASIKVNEVRGGCNPAPLSRKVVGDNLVIQVKDIVEQGSSYFDFSGGRGV